MKKIITGLIGMILFSALGFCDVEYGHKNISKTNNTFTGNNSFSGNVTLNDANADYTVVKGTFTVETASATFTGDAQVNGTSTLNGNVIINDSAGDYTLVKGTFTLANSSSMTVTGAMQVDGATTLNGNTTIGDSLSDSVTNNAGTNIFAKTGSTNSITCSSFTFISNGSTTYPVDFILNTNGMRFLPSVANGAIVIQLSASSSMSAWGQLKYSPSESKIILGDAGSYGVCLRNGSQDTLVCNTALSTFANNISAKASLFVSSATTSIPLEIRGQGGTSTDTLFKITSSSVATMTGDLSVSGISTLSSTTTIANTSLTISTQTITPNNTVSTNVVLFSSCPANNNVAELNVIDGAGNVTQLSPHDNKNEWIFDSYNQRTGKRVYIPMERFIRRFEEITGEKFIFGSEQEYETYIRE